VRRIREDKASAIPAGDPFGTNAPGGQEGEEPEDGEEDDKPEGKPEEEAVAA
jgi:hypothetical protein